jgi:6-phosphogluconate dehydrogenase
MQLWRGGCTIQSDYIVDIPEKVHHRNNHDDDLLSSKEIDNELGKAFPSLKKVVLKAINAYANIPSLSALVEYYKYPSSTDLPGQ